MTDDKQSLTVEDYRALAELSQHAGFRLLCDVVQADIDDLANDLATTQSDEAEKRLLAQWRALRSLLGTLQTMPSWAGDQVQALTDNDLMQSQVLAGEMMTPEEASSIYDQFTDAQPKPSKLNWYGPAKFEGLDDVT